MTFAQRHLVLYGLLFTSVLLVAWGAGGASFPLGVPGEWEWRRVTPSESLVLALLPVLVAAALYLGFVWLSQRSITTCRRSGLAARLAGLALAGFAWLWVAQESAPDGYQLSKAVWILYYRGSSGYFSEARDQAADLAQYLGRYEKKMQEGDVLHIGTHPPGLTVALRTLLGLCEAAPWLVDMLDAAEPASVRAAFDELKQHEPLSRNDRAVLWLAALLVQAGAALTVVPLFGLLRLSCGRRSSWQAAAFWPTVPALALFLPKSDCLFPLVAMMFLWFWQTGVARPSRWNCLIAGFVIWLGLTLSLAFLPMGFLALLAGFWTLRKRSPNVQQPVAAAFDQPASPTVIGRNSIREALRQFFPSIVFGAVGFAVPILGTWLIARINLLNVWRLNFQNHADFYRQFPRTYWKWLLVNPVEFMVAAGLPLAIFAVWSLFAVARRQRPGQNSHTAAWLTTMAVLWISGKNMGEAARLWIFMTPFLVWILGPLFESAEHPTSDAASGESPIPESTWAVALGVQLLFTAVLVTQIAGFHLPEPVPVVAIVPVP